MTPAYAGLCRQTMSGSARWNTAWTLRSRRGDAMRLPALAVGMLVAASSWGQGPPVASREVPPIEVVREVPEWFHVPGPRAGVGSHAVFDVAVALALHDLIVRAAMSQSAATGVTSRQLVSSKLGPLEVSGLLKVEDQGDASTSQLTVRLSKGTQAKLVTYLATTSTVPGHEEELVNLQWTGGESLQGTMTELEREVGVSFRVALGTAGRQGEYLVKATMRAPDPSLVQAILHDLNLVSGRALPNVPARRATYTQQCSRGERVACVLAASPTLPVQDLKAVSLAELEKGCTVVHVPTCIAMASLPAPPSGPSPALVEARRIACFFGNVCAAVQ